MGLASRQGTNLQAVLDASANHRLPVRVKAVISHAKDAPSLERARRARVPAYTLVPIAGESREEFDSRLADVVGNYDPDLVVCAGWMRLLSDAFLYRFPQETINLHPALPGQFPGLHAIRRAYESFSRGEIHETGATVHKLTEAIDDGPVIASEIVSMLRGEPFDRFAMRMHATEHHVLVEALAKLCHTAA